MRGTSSCAAPVYLNQASTVQSELPQMEAPDKKEMPLKVCMRLVEKVTALTPPVVDLVGFTFVSCWMV